MMNRLSRSLLLTTFLAVFAGPTFAEVQTSDYTQTRIGMIHSLDLANKTAVISGYRYGFTGAQGWDLPSIKMYNTDFGAFELLKTGMKVRVTYRLSKSSRIVVAMRQVADDARLGVPDVFE